MVLPPESFRTRSSTLQAFIRACELDVQTLKPGNVSLGSAGHGMTAEQFLASAAAAAPAVCASGVPIGQRILDATRASLAVAHCNTNLGIVLLCAPVAAALQSLDSSASTGVLAAPARSPAPQALRVELERQLSALTVVDARDAFRAIVLANPGGLGAAAEQDVQHEPTVGLREAMRLASDRDLIARQYATGFAEVFETGLAAWQAASGCAEGLQSAMQRVYLAFLAAFPDSHILRKHGLVAAQAVSTEARYWCTRLAEDARSAQPALAQWDRRLKDAGFNPGTSADLAVATAFVAQAVS